MQGLVLIVFSKLEHVPFIKDILATYTRTGIYHYWVRLYQRHLVPLGWQEKKTIYNEIGVKFCL